MFKYLRDKVVGTDMFGHMVAFNFNKKGETYNTLLGGLASFITRIVLFAYLWQQTAKMLTHGNNNISSETSVANLTELGEVPLKGE